MPHREIDTLTMSVQGTEVSIDLSRIPGPHKHIALVPQWDFLELLAGGRREGADVPAAAQHRGARADNRAGTRRQVIGVSYRGADGQVREMRAALTVACDGRSSTLRSAMGLRPRSFGAPMDVWWFRLPRDADDPHGLAGVLGAGAAQVRHRSRRLLPVRLRHPQGPRRRSCARRASRRCTAAWWPWCRGWPATSRALTSFDDVKLLDVQLNRLRRWYTDGLLLIGDAAHAMSPGRRRRHQPRGRRRRRGGPDTGRSAARGHRVHPAAGPRPGPAMGACGADPGRAAAGPQPRHRGGRVVDGAGQTAAAGADRGTVSAAAHRGRIRDRDRPASRTRAGVCPALIAARGTRMS